MSPFQINFFSYLGSQLTIHLTHVGGTKVYKSPPLRKGEIMAEVSGFLTNNDLFRTRLARTLDLYSRDSLSSDLPHDEHESNLDDNRNLDLSSSHLEPTPQRPGINRLFSHHASSGTPDFDRLASLNGLHNTENLIEAIFNPVPTMSK